jgi:ribosomal protein L11 methyltransferase
MVVPRRRAEDMGARLIGMGSLGTQEDWLPGEAPAPLQPWDTGPPPTPPDRVLLKSWWPEAVDPAGLVAELHGWSDVAEISQAHCAEEDWSEAWKALVPRVRISSRLAVAPPWRAEPGDLVVEPGMAFGSGAHPTTLACLRAVDAHAVPGGSCLDVGCGSGVLALAAAQLGMRARGIDIDPECIRASLSAAEANRLDVCFDTMPLAKVDGTYELVVANLYAEVLVVMAPDLQRLCGGHLALAGILADRAHLVTDALGQMEIVSRVQDGEWMSLVFRACM